MHDWQGHERCRLDPIQPSRMLLGMAAAFFLGGGEKMLHFGFRHAVDMCALSKTELLWAAASQGEQKTYFTVWN